MDVEESFASEAKQTSRPPLDRSFQWFRRLADRQGGNHFARKTRLSFILGLFGTALLSILCMQVRSYEFFLRGTLEEFGLTFPLITVLLHVISTAPVGFGFAIAVFVPMFCHHSLILRFIIAVILVTLAVIAYLFSISEEFGSFTNDWWGRTIFAICFSLGVGVVASAAQWMNQWSLSPLRDPDAPSPKASIGQLMQLIFLTAIGCIFFRSFLNSDLVRPILLLMFSGSMFALSMLIVTLCFFTNIRNKKLIGFIGLSLWATLLICFEQKQLLDHGSANRIFRGAFTGFQPSGPSWLSLLPYSIAGGVMSSLVSVLIVWCQLYWLRGCGWSVISRQGVRDSQ